MIRMENLSGVFPNQTRKKTCDFINSMQDWIFSTIYWFWKGVCKSTCYVREFFRLVSCVIWTSFFTFFHQNLIGCSCLLEIDIFNVIVYKNAVHWMRRVDLLLGNRLGGTGKNVLKRGRIGHFGSKGALQRVLWPPCEI